MKKTLHKMLVLALFIAGITTINAQTITLTANGVIDEINLEGSFGTGTVTVVLADVPTTFNGSIFLSVFNDAAASKANPSIRKTITLAVSAANSEVVNGMVKTVTWENIVALPEAGTHTSAVELNAADVGNEYDLLVRGFNFSGPMTAGADSNTLPINIVDDPTFSIGDFNKTELISFHPNPATDIITVGDDVITETYKVVNLSGALVKEVPANGELVVADLVAGVYFLVTDEGTAKFIKQ